MRNAMLGIVCAFTTCMAIEPENEWISITKDSNPKYEMLLNGRIQLAHEGTDKVVTAWTKTISKKPNKTSKGAYILKQSKYNCDKTTETILHVISYTKQGAVKTDITIPDYELKEESIPPGTNNEVIIDIACQAK